MINAGSSKAPVNLLIIDDNRDFADNMAELARSEAVRPLRAASLREALEVVRDQQVDIAMVDHRLPDGKGSEFLRSTRESHPDLVSIFVTGFASSQTTVKALNEGAFAFVTKDSEPELFLDAIHRAVQNAQLKRENRRLRITQQAILSGIPDQLLLVDEKLNVLGANRRYGDFCGAEDFRSALPRPLLQLLSERVRDRYDWAGLVGRAYEEDLPRPMLAVREPGGGTRFYNIRCVPVVQEPVRVVLIQIGDLTRQIDLERRLNESESLAKVGRLVAIIAHEIRNPITGIRALAQLLARQAEDESARESIDEIQALADRMTATLADLLQYARPNEREEQRISVRDLMVELVSEGRRWPSCEGRKLELRADDGAEALVLGQRQRLFSALSNLVENGLQATPEGGEVRLSHHNQGDWCVLAVDDSGPGVAEEDRYRLFEPFYSRKKGGTGLGLAIVKAAIDAHGGSIEVRRSSDLGGATFEVRLPLIPAQVGEGVR